MTPIQTVKYSWDGKTYRLLETITYYSPRYRKQVTAFEGDIFDGATGPGVIDVCPHAWIIHDCLCLGFWDDGSAVKNIEASMVVGDILSDYGRWFRRWTWPIFTFLFGGNNLEKW